MQARDAQLLLQKANYYDGAIDNDPGPKTMRAVEVVGDNRGGWPTAWGQKRRMIAAGQAILDAMGFEPGTVDGLAGYNTEQALTAFYETQAGRKPTLERPKPSAPTSSADWPVNNTSALTRFYGKPGSSAATQGKVRLPIAFPIAWDGTQHINSYSCHAKVEDEMTLIWQRAVNHYGETEFRRLRLDQYGGCFNDRSMRGGSRKSTHAWGIAYDVDPIKNQLRWGRDRALLARADYVPFWNIVEGVGATSLGRAANYDWMHFQFADQT